MSLSYDGSFLYPSKECRYLRGTIPQEIELRDSLNSTPQHLQLHLEIALCSEVPEVGSRWQQQQQQTPANALA